MMILERKLCGASVAAIKQRPVSAAQFVVNAIRGWVLMGMMAVAQAAPAEPLQPLKDIPTHIKSQPLAEALTAWAELTGYQIVVPQSEAAERAVQPIKGNMSAQESLDRLLAGTGLNFELINDRTVAIMQDYLRPPQPMTGPKPELMLASLEKVEVTGSRLLMPPSDIKANGWPQTPAPVVVFDRDRLDALGVSTGPEMLRFLPQQPYGPIAEHRSKNSGQYAEIRGLGRDMTLVLIDGRRTIPSSASVTLNAFDLNTLPLAAVERVEVLSDSAAAVYGTDAVGGVINFVLKKEIPRPVLEFSSGTASGGAEERQVSFGAGYSNERLHTLMVLDYFEREPLLGAERDRWANQDFRRFGGQDFRAFSGNITSLTSANLPGLPSRFAAVPSGSTGIGLTPADFLPTAGQRNSDSHYRFLSIIPEARRPSAAALAQFDLTPAVNVFGELLYVDDRTTSYSAPTAQTLTVPADNPYNPFDVAVSVDYLFRGLTRTYHVESDRYRAVAGIRGALRAWDWELSVLTIDDEGSSWWENAIDVTKANRALAAADPAQALNVFSDGPGGSAALLESLTAAPLPETYASHGTQWAGVLRGQLLTLPAGAVDVVLGSEWLKSDMLYDDSSSASVRGGRSVAAAFTELRLPVVNPAMHVPAVRKLSLTLAARYDYYTDVGDSFNPQYGLVWMPTAELNLRASYGTSFRAPSLFELNAWEVTSHGILTPDPLRNNEITPVDFMGGGNPDLDPIESNSLTAGFDLMPSAWKGLQLSGTYWRITMDKQVHVLRYDVLASHWEQFPDRVIRAARTAADVAAGLPGRLIFMDLTRMNFGTLQTRGIDLAAKHEIETRLGHFSPSLSATWIDAYTTQDIPGSLATNRVGIANGRGTIARWKAVATLGWSRQGASLSATARYTASYDDADVLGNRTGRAIPSQTLIDLQGSLDFEQLQGRPSGWLSGLKLTVGVSNLFDKEPSFAQIGYDAGYDYTQGDLRQRFGYVKLSARF